MNEKKIPIKVFDYPAYVTRITASYSNTLEAIVEFNPPVHGLLSFAVNIPAKEYTREELIKTVETESKKRLQTHIEEKERQERDHTEHERLKKLAEKISKEIELT